MRCPSCGYQNPDGSNFCNFCGKTLATSAAAPAQPVPSQAYSAPPVSSERPRQCVSCGRSISWTANVCPYCGHDYRVLSYGYPQHEEISSGLRIVLYILSVLIPIAGLIIGIVFYVKPDPESKRVGKNCIIIAIVVWVTAAVITIAIFAAITASFGAVISPVASLIR